MKDKRRQLAELLNDEQGREFFTRYLRSEHSEENLLFLDNVSKYQYAASITTNRDMVVREAWRIYTTFLHDVSNGKGEIGNENEMKVNIPAVVADPINKIFTTAKNDPSVLTDKIFQPARKHVTKLMANDCFVRFVRSPEYKEFIASRPDDVWSRRNKALGLI